MLYIIGLGLGDERDITVRGLDAVRSCHKVYVEAYTSLLSFGLASDGLSRMEKLYGRDVVVADREMVEERAAEILSEAVDSDVAFLVVGDPFGYDIRVKEPSLESLCRGRKCYEPPKYMTIHIAINQLLEVEETNGGSGTYHCIVILCFPAYNAETQCVGIARLGNDDQMIVAGSMKELLDIDFGPPLHCLVIVGETHPVEEEMLEFYSIKS
ncbi:hypothetical protein B296_00021185 [Ensete ventricosum]|uniref:diphthine methyl ester synthase n=1 Tax=Ensete ventricosum TaxID=4639 RepID=A0A427ASP5_ENSVE|nr:hypothetical protein B296_00021185 [Ensete ventricosum]